MTVAFGRMKAEALQLFLKKHQILHTFNLTLLSGFTFIRYDINITNHKEND